MSELKVNKVTPRSGTTVTLGDSGDTITIPSGATTTLTDGVSGDFKMNSGFGSIATAYGCRAWVNFNGTGTPAINGSGNVTSITDNGTGNYTINFTTAFPDTNYIFTGNPNYGDTGARNLTIDYDPINDTKTASAHQVRVSWVNAGTSRTIIDVEVIGIAFFR